MPDALREAARTGARTATVMTSGFEEAAEEGAGLTAALRRAVEETGLAIVPALHDMQRDTIEVDARATWHMPMVAEIKSSLAPLTGRFVIVIFYLKISVQTKELILPPTFQRPQETRRRGLVR